MPAIDAAGGRRPVRRARGAARAIGARDLRGDAAGIVERRQRLRDAPRLGDAGGDEVRVVLGDVLRELVDDVGFARGSTGQRRRAGRGRAPSSRAHPAARRQAWPMPATRFSAAKNVLQLRRCASSTFCPRRSAGRSGGAACRLSRPIALDEAAALEAIERRVERGDVELQRAGRSGVSISLAIS